MDIESRSEIEEDSEFEVNEGNTRKRKHKGNGINHRITKRFKTTEEDLNSENIIEKIKNCRKIIYNDYVHGDLILNFEKAKALYENKSYLEFISVFTPTFNKIIQRQLDIEKYEHLLRTEYTLNYNIPLIEKEQTNNPPLPPSNEPFFIQNHNLYKNLESERLKKEKKIKLESINTEIESLPNLYQELNEKIIEDSLYKLILEISRNKQESLLTEGFVDNLWTTKMFNRYPESPKVLMIYMILFK